MINHDNTTQIFGDTIPEADRTPMTLDELWNSYDRKDEELRKARNEVESLKDYNGADAEVKRKKAQDTVDSILRQISHLTSLMSQFSPSSKM